VNAKHLTPHDERRVAVQAGCDPRTVRAYLAGRSVRSTVASRVRGALEALGMPGRGSSPPSAEGAA
jgi:hypothetical protein